MNSDQSKKIFTNSLSQTAQFFMIGVILSIAFFLFLSSIIRAYSSTITILVDAKSQVAAEQHDHIVRNIVEFPRTLTFYDRLLKSNPDVRDVAQGKSQIERTEAWNNMLSVDPVENSSIIKITILAQRKSDADQLASKTVRTLFDTVSIYYDIKNDVDLRIIDGPISKEVRMGWQWIILLSVLLGATIAFVLQQILLMYLKIKEDETEKQQDHQFSEESHYAQETPIFQEHEPFSPQESKEEMGSRAKQNSSSPEMEMLSKIIEQDTYPNYPEMPVHATPKASAPANLPIADDSFYDFSEQKTSEKNVEEVEKKEEPKKNPTDEPSAQELKKRLNQLLRGEM